MNLTSLLSDFIHGTLFEVRGLPKRSKLNPGDPDTLRFFNQHGWVHWKSALNQSEVTRFKSALKHADEDKHTGDLLTHPELGAVVTHPRVLELLKSVLGTEELMWFGDASWSHSNTPTKGGIGFHKDMVDKDGDGNTPDWREPDYNIVRVGIYLNNYTHASGGLALRDRSHLEPTAQKGTPFVVSNAPGDLLIWSLKTTHSGFASKPSVLPVFVPIGVQSRLAFKGERFSPEPLFLPEPEKQTRPAFFLTYAKDGPSLRRYLRYLKTRTFAVKNWQQTHYTKSHIEQLERAGLGLIDLSDEARAIDLSLTNTFHKPFVDITTP